MSTIPTERGEQSSFLPESPEDKHIEQLARKLARKRSQVKELKGAIGELEEQLTAALKMLPKRFYLRGPVRAWIESKEALGLEVKDETGEA